MSNAKISKVCRPMEPLFEVVASLPYPSGAVALDLHSGAARAQRGGEGAAEPDQGGPHDSPRRALPLDKPGAALLEPLQRVAGVHEAVGRRGQVQAPSSVLGFHLPRLLG